MLQIRLLGQFEIQRDGQALALNSKQAQLLLAYLLLPPGRRHRRERLAGLLWPEVDDEKARSRLRYALWQLRQFLGSEVVTAGKLEIAFEGGAETWLDTAALERPLTSPPDLERLQEQVSVYNGELLPDFYEDWLLLERSRLRAVFERKMEVLLGGLLAAERFAAVVEQSEHWISSGQPPEKAFRALMTGHALRGDTSAAAQGYRRCVRMLEEELGVAPSSTTEALYQAITTDASQADILANCGFESWLPTGPGRPVQGREPLLPAAGEQRPPVAREQELAWLSEKWQAARDGHGSLALLTGEAGRGKSTLLWEFARQLLESGNDLLVAAGRGEAYFGQGDPHLLFRDVLALLAGDVEGRSTRETISQTNARRLWQRAPLTAEILLDLGPDLLESFIPGQALFHRLGQIDPAGTDLLDRLQSQLRVIGERFSPIHVAHGDTQRATFDQYTQVLRALAARQPLLILLDDLQWADRGSLDLLFHLCRRIEHVAIFIVAAVRQDDLAGDAVSESHPLRPMLAEFGRIFGDYRLDLDRLDKDKGHRLSNALLDLEANRYDDTFREQMVRLAGGHPLFTLELLRQMQERGELARDEQGRWYQAREVDWSILPARVEAVIAGRILNLPAELRQILSLASIEGQKFTVEVLAATLEREPGELLALLDGQLHRRHQLVEPLKTLRIGNKQVARYGFQHQLFQGYLYNRQEATLRARRHENCARALEAIYRSDLEATATRLATHFEKAGLLGEARNYLLMAGEYAKRQSADWEAIRSLQRGLLLLEGEPPSARRDNQELAFQAALGPPLVAVNGWSSVEAEAAFERARELANALGQTRWLPPILWGLWSYFLLKGKHDRAMSSAVQILERTNDGDRQELFLTAHWTLGISSAVTGSWNQSAEHLALAVESYDEQSQHDLIYRYGQSPGVTCLFWLALARWMLGDTQGALADCQRCLDMAQREGHNFSLAFGTACAAGLYAINNDPDLAGKVSNQALQLARQGGYPFLRAMALITRGWAAVKQADGTATTREIQKGLMVMEAMGARLFLPFFLALATDAELELGNVSAAGELLDQAFAAGQEDGDHSVLAHLHLLKARQLADGGAESTLVQTELEKSAEIASQQGAEQLVRRAASLRQKLLAERP